MDLSARIDHPVYLEPSLKFLKLAIALILGASAAFVIAISILVPDQALRALGPASMSAVALIAWYQISRGRIQSSIQVLAYGVWATVTVIAFFTGGVGGMAIIIYPQIILLLGWMIGKRAAVAMTALTVATTLAFVLLEWRGLLPSPPPTPPAMRWIVQSGIFVSSVILVSYFVRSYQSRLKEVIDLGSDLNRAQAVAHVGSWVYDLARDLIHLSAETCRIFAVPEGAKSSYGVYLSRVHPEDRAGVDSAWKKAAKEGKPFESEHRILVGKSIRWVRQRAELEFGVEGRPLRGVGTTQDVTDRRQAEESLKESEFRSKFAIESTGLGVLDWDLLTGKMHVSDRWLQMTGFTRDELPPRLESLSALAHPDDLSTAMADVQQVLEGRKAVHVVERRLKHKQGHWIWVQSRSMISTRSDRGEPLRMIGTHLGITERKRSESAAERERMRLQTILRMASDGIHVVDSDGLLVEANDAFLNLLGYDRAAIGTLRITDWSGLESWAVIKARNDDLIARRGQALFEAPVRRRDGVILDMEINASGIEIDGKGYLYAAFRNITERKRTEAALRESENRLSAIFRASPIGISVNTIADGTIMDVNDAALRMYGYSRDQVIGRTTLGLGIYVDPGQRAELLRQLKERGSVDQLLVHIRKGNGEFGQAEISCCVVTLQGEQRLLSMMVDVTKREQVGAARMQLEVQLRESQKMEALGTLAGGVAHDFNNVLAAIVGNVELARQDVGPSHEALVSLEEIAKASRRAKDLVQQILAFGRRQTLERKATSLALVVVETARLVRATLSAMVSLTVNCEGDTPAVLADATQVKQILLNLCGNANQAIQDKEHAGLIEVKLRAYVQTEDGTHAKLRPGRYACLTIRDNGSGMDETTRLRIFEPFFTTKPVGRGTGLGLSVVHGIVQAHEASIEVESALGEGSAFHVYFPAIDAPVEEAAPPKSGAAPVDGAGKRVLYVDDDEAIVFLMKRLLERQGFRVSGYTDPREALAAVRADPGQFDLAVTDYNMSGMSGLQVAEALREIRADLPVVLASGYITEELRQKAPAAGVRELIYKPNTADDLCEAVARYANAQNKTAS